MFINAVKWEREISFLKVYYVPAILITMMIFSFVLQAMHPSRLKSETVIPLYSSQ